MRAWIALGIVGLLLAAAPLAQAGTYNVWSCMLPNGQPAEVSGWSVGAEASAQVRNSCDTGNGLSVALWSDEVGYWAEAWWRFSAPTDTEIDNFTFVRAAAISDDREYHLYRNFASGSSWPPAQTDAENASHGGIRV